MIWIVSLQCTSPILTDIHWFPFCEISARGFTWTLHKFTQPKCKKKLVLGEIMFDPIYSKLIFRNLSRVKHVDTLTKVFQSSPYHIKIKMTPTVLNLLLKKKGPQFLPQLVPNSPLSDTNTVLVLLKFHLNELLTYSKHNLCSPNGIAKRIAWLGNLWKNQFNGEPSHKSISFELSLNIYIYSQNDYSILQPLICKSKHISLPCSKVPNNFHLG